MKYSDKVLEFATKAHAGQVRKYTGVPYITHPIAVAEIAVKRHLENERFDDGDKNELVLEIIRSIAYLHDILEDTEVTIGELREFLKSISTSMDDEISSGVIIDAVLLLTKSQNNFDLFGYLDAIKFNFYAKLVKLADNEHNSSDLKDQKKLDTYKLIRYYLTH